MINKIKLLKRSIIAALLLSIGFVGGALFGLGLTSSFMMFTSQIPDGAMAVGQLVRLEKGDSAPTKQILESQVDEALAEYSYASEEWWFPLYEDGLSLISPQDVDGWMRHIATYRKSHPSPYRDVMAASNRGYQQRIDAMVKKFADK